MPARLDIEGGIALRGTVTPSAAKNAALPALSASLLTSAPVTIVNLPSLNDVRTMLKLLETLGAKVERAGEATRVWVERVSDDLAPYELVSTMRASVLVLGPLVARHGSARVALPGGCAIGVQTHRPAPEGAGEARGRGIHRERIRGGPGQPAQGGAHHHGSRHRDGDRESHDGGRPRRGHHGHRERRARARGRRPRRAPECHGGQGARRRDRAPGDRGRRRS